MKVVLRGDGEDDGQVQGARWDSCESVRAAIGRQSEEGVEADGDRREVPLSHDTDDDEAKLGERHNERAGVVSWSRDIREQAGEVVDGAALERLRLHKE
jgi:hypothetical protein